MTSAIDILCGARGIIIDPSRWTQGCTARTEKNKRVAAKSKKACKFCIVGAMEKSGFRWGKGFVWQNIRWAFLGLEMYDLAHYNDNHSHGQVVHLLDKAIERLQNDKKPNGYKTPQK